MQAVVFAQPCNALIYKNKDAVAFDGCISTQSVNVLLEALYNKDVKVLLMRSTGGSAPDSFSLAKRIHELRLTLVLRGNCYSACSTYILPAAESVIVEEGTLILFHGDARIGVAMNEEA